MSDALRSVRAHRVGGPRCHNYTLQLRTRGSRTRGRPCGAAYLRDGLVLAARRQGVPMTGGANPFPTA
jgi:hypothetical protein